MLAKCAPLENVHVYKMGENTCYCGESMNPYRSQPAPTGSENSTKILDLVIDDISNIKNSKSFCVDELNLVLGDLKVRAEEGNKKYGTYLMSHNGRNPLMDAYEEALDMVMYLRQSIEENEVTDDYDMNIYYSAMGICTYLRKKVGN